MDTTIEGLVKKAREAGEEDKGEEREVKRLMKGMDMVVQPDSQSSDYEENTNYETYLVGRMEESYSED